MSPTAEHPAAALPEAERLEYLRLVASMAIADGRTAAAEMAKLERLGLALRLPPATTTPLMNAVREGRLDAPAPTEGARWFQGDSQVRWHLMIDSIVIAFSDGELASKESQRIAQLAGLLEVPPGEVARMAGLVEQILWKRDADQAALARELGAAVGAPDSGVRMIGTMKLIAGTRTRPPAA